MNICFKGKEIKVEERVRGEEEVGVEVKVDRLAAVGEKVDKDEEEATSPALVQVGTVFAQSVGIKNRTRLGNAVLTRPARSAEQR